MDYLPHFQEDVPHSPCD